MGLGAAVLQGATTATQDDAQKIADTLLQQRLAACVQISGPITSSYWWEAKIDRSAEWLCTIKTRRDLYGSVERAIRDAHSYDEPEILATLVVDGSAGYLKWLDEQVRQ